jgi:hypothetical protein
VWASALLAAALLVGGAAGWAARGPSAGRCTPKFRDTKAMVSFLTRELNLSPSQQDSVRAIFHRHRAAMEAIWRTVHFRYDTLRAVLESEISAQLTPEQQRRHRELQDRIARERRAADSAVTGLR